MADVQDESLIVRRWTAQDIPSVRHIAWTTWVATYGSFIPKEDILAFFNTYYTEEILIQFCEAEAARGFIAKISGRAAGFAKTHFDCSMLEFHLDSLYVLPEFQGKGIGSSLLRVCEDFAVSLNASEMWLGVMTQNTTAFEWYTRIGFEFVREEPFTMGRTTVQHRIGFRTITKEDVHV